MQVSEQHNSEQPAAAAPSRCLSPPQVRRPAGPLSASFCHHINLAVDSVLFILKVIECLGFNQYLLSSSVSILVWNV